MKFSSNFIELTAYYSKDETTAPGKISFNRQHIAWFMEHYDQGKSLVNGFKVVESYDEIKKMIEDGSMLTIKEDEQDWEK